MSTFEKLVGGYRVFKATTYPQRKDLIHHFIQLGMKPTTLVITSCSMQISPEMLTASNPGELYVIRNMGGLVPPYSEGRAHGTISAIEYAVEELEVENIIVLGHSKCDVITLLLDEAKEERLRDSNNPMMVWANMLTDVKNAVKEQLKRKSRDEQEAACEQEAVLMSLKNLISYPFIERRIDANTIGIYGWHFELATGIVRSFNPESKMFEAVD